MSDKTIPDNYTTQKVVSDWFYLLVGMRPMTEDLSNLITNINLTLKKLDETNGQNQVVTQ